MTRRLEPFDQRDPGLLALGAPAGLSTDRALPGRRPAARRSLPSPLVRGRRRCAPVRSAHRANAGRRGAPWSSAREDAAQLSEQGARAAHRDAQVVDRVAVGARAHVAGNDRFSMRRRGGGERRENLARGGVGRRLAIEVGQARAFAGTFGGPPRRATGGSCGGCSRSRTRPRAPAREAFAFALAVVRAGILAARLRSTSVISPPHSQDRRSNLPESPQ